jgi:hypothetical protein
MFESSGYSNIILREDIYGKERMIRAGNAHVR